MAFIRRDRSSNSNASSLNTMIRVSLLVGLCVWVLHMSGNSNSQAAWDSASSAILSVTTDTASGMANQASAALQRTTQSAPATISSPYPGWDPSNPLAVPQGGAPNLPSIRVEDQNQKGNVDANRKIYGGKGDQQHLGGFTQFDVHGVSPTVWKHMIQDYGVHSLLDVGCGRGISSSWFDFHGVDVLCAEGSHDAVTKSILPHPAQQVVEHDFSRGPWWPAQTYDAVWAVEFLEHVGVNYHFNYISAFRKAALLFVSSSRWGGWHHVEVHSDEWWIRKYEMYGFQYDEKLTEEVRGWALAESRNKTLGKAPNGEDWNAQHVWLTMKVFINPAVAALPEHAHLMATTPGCFDRREKEKIIGRPCDAQQGESEITDAKFQPLPLTPKMDQDWDAHIKEHIMKGYSSDEKAKLEK